MDILRHLVVEYRRTQFVFTLNHRACAFQPDGLWQTTAVELPNQLVKLIFHTEPVLKYFFIRDS